MIASGGEQGDSLLTSGLVGNKDSRVNYLRKGAPLRNVLGITVGILLVASIGFSKTASKPKWAVERLYVEACQCSVPCPFNFGQKPTHGSCDHTSVYQIEKGKWVTSFRPSVIRKPRQCRDTTPCRAAAY